MAELVFSITASADRYRLGLDGVRSRTEQRDTRTTLTNTRIAEVERRTEIITEDVRRRENAIRLRRDDLEYDLEQSITLREQQLNADRIADDAGFRRLRDGITEELNGIRADRAFVDGRTLSEFDEGLALDQIEGGPAPGPTTEITGPDGGGAFQDFLAARDERLAERRDEDRDFQVQQQIDLRLADDNVRDVTPNVDLPRGSIVDVFG